MWGLIHGSTDHQSFMLTITSKCQLWVRDKSLHKTSVMLHWFRLNSSKSSNSVNLIQNRKNTNVGILVLWRVCKRKTLTEEKRLHCTFDCSWRVSNFCVLILFFDTADTMDGRIGWNIVFLFQTNVSVRGTEEILTIRIKAKSSF